jgi:hypothetical protein
LRLVLAPGCSSTHLLVVCMCSKQEGCGSAVAEAQDAVKASVAAGTFLPCALQQLQGSCPIGCHPGGPASGQLLVDLILQGGGGAR